MRDKVNVLYYPEATAEELTLKKAILFFDEIHFMDRPSFSFEGGLGSIGAASPLRNWEHLFKRDNVPIIIHEAPGGRMGGELLEQVAADVNDPVYLERFQAGLRQSLAFRCLHIQEGNYGDIETQKMYSAAEVAEQYVALDLPAALSGFASPMALLTDKNVKPFAFSRPENIAKTVVFAAALCSAKVNHALSTGVSEGFVPFADAAPYGGLLAAKYTRAIDKLEPENNKLPITNLSFAIFDSLVDAEVLARMPMKDVIRYRHESTDAREAFLEYLSALQWKANGIGVDASYDEAIEKLIATEIIPASRAFQNKMKTIGEAFLGSLGKGQFSCSEICRWQRS
jgi:hypothetical protein